MSSPPRVVAFDAVGTLFYADPPVADVYSGIACEFGVAIEPANVRRRFAAAMKQVPARTPLDDDVERERWIERVRFVFEGTNAARFDEFFEALWRRFAEPAAWRLYEDVDDALNIADGAGLRSVVASNFDVRLIRIVETLLPGRFEQVFPATLLGAAKPDGEFFRAVQGRLDVSRDRIVLIGDDPRDDGAGATFAGWSYRLVSSDPVERRPRSATSLATLVASLTRTSA